MRTLTPQAQSELSRIRQVRTGLLIAAGAFVLWWIVEFVTYAGRTSGFDAFDLLLILIAVAIGALLYQAWQSRCPQCANRFFINRGLPLGFHVSTQCPFCGARLSDFEERLR